MPHGHAEGRRGALVVIEGLDRSGKTTQCARLLTRLEREGVRAEMIKFPDRTTAIGKMIDGYLRSESELDDRAVHLLFSANRWELASRIENMLQQGTLVLCDRYAFSGVAFTAAKPNAPTVEWCAAPDAGLPSPDRTIFLDVSKEVQRTRGGFGEERYENEERQGRVRKAFGELRGRTKPKWVVVDAGQELDRVETEVWEAVGAVLAGVDGPVGRLWDGSSTVPQRV